jgi:hypothetical protein
MALPIPGSSCGSQLLYSKDIGIGCVYLYIICMYVCMYIWALLSKTWVGWVGPGDSLYKVSYKSKYGSKALDQESWGDDTWGYLAPSPYITGQMEAFYD